MNCRECSEFLALYLAGELEQETTVAFTLHLSRCRNCEEYLHQYRDTIIAGRVACTQDDPDAAMPEELIRAILAARKR